MSNSAAWLAVAVIADLGSYWSASEVSAPWFWIAVDLWLAYRIWQRRPVALTVYRFLQVAGAALFGVVIASSLWDGSVGTGATPGSVALLAISSWCLFAPALSRHVRRSRSDEASAAPVTVS